MIIFFKQPISVYCDIYFFHIRGIKAFSMTSQHSETSQWETMQRIHLKKLSRGRWQLTKQGCFFYLFANVLHMKFCQQNPWNLSSWLRGFINIITCYVYIQHGPWLSISIKTKAIISFDSIKVYTGVSWCTYGVLRQRQQADQCIEVVCM